MRSNVEVTMPGLWQALPCFPSSADLPMTCRIDRLALHLCFPVTTAASGQPAAAGEIIAEQKITKAEFAKRVGITENYIYILTTNGPSRENVNKKISPALAKLIALEFGYDEKWVLNGES